MSSLPRLPVSYFPDYLCLDDILATSEKIPCEFEITFSGMGSLDPSGSSSDLKEGKKLELPVWMVNALRPRLKLVTCTMPRAFNDRNREILGADPALVDLHSLSPHFYEFGRNIIPLVSKADAPKLGILLVKTLKKRIRSIMIKSLNCQEQDTPGLKAIFDQLERRLFQAGRWSVHDHQLWLARRSHFIHSLPTLQEHETSSGSSGSGGCKRKISEVN